MAAEAERATARATDRAVALPWPQAVPPWEVEASIATLAMAWDTAYNKYSNNGSLSTGDAQGSKAVGCLHNQGGARGTRHGGEVANKDQERGTQPLYQQAHKCRAG